MTALKQSCAESYVLNSEFHLSVLVFSVVNITLLQFPISL